MTSSRSKVIHPKEEIKCYHEAKKCIWCQEWYIGSSFWKHLRKCRKDFFAAFGHEVK